MRAGGPACTAVAGWSAPCSPSPSPLPQSPSSRTSAVSPFPTSARPEAQEHFLRGVAILHSFGWKQAIAEFQARAEDRAGFRPGVLGRDALLQPPSERRAWTRKKPREVLARLGAIERSASGEGADARARRDSSRRRGAWGAKDDWRARRVAYMDEMARLYKEFPDDDEVKTFYALSILSGARALEDDDFPAWRSRRALWRWTCSSETETIRVRRTTSSMPSTIRSTRLSRSRLRMSTRTSPRRFRTLSTCRRTSTSSTGCGRRCRTRTCARTRWRRSSGKQGERAGDMSHSVDWGQYGFLQKGDYAGARERIEGVRVKWSRPRRSSASSARSRSSKRPLYHRERGVEGAGGGRGRLGRGDPRERNERGEHGRH